ncbi:MAG TPA: hypothetical protein VFH91_07055, partial [Pyrinomonadaceae bacterium]|nr:hypothetical protein [Pyrinomonadaceae bacterium]
TLFGTGKPGQADGASPSFYEPGGLSVAGNKVYVADTNNHAIRVIDLKTRQTSTLRINGLMPPVQSVASSSSDSAPNAETLKAPAQSLRPGTNAILSIDVALPDGYHLNPAAPQRYKISVDTEKSIKIDAKNAQHSAKSLSLPLRIPISASEPGSAKVRAQVTLFYCREDNTGTCRIKTLVWEVPVEVSNNPGAGTEIKLKGKLSVD